jgi:rhomboid protease GluP
MIGSSAQFLPRLVQLGKWRTLDEAHEHALVVLAMGRDCSVHPITGGYELLASPDDAETAMQELDLYASEQSHLHLVPESDSIDHPAGLVWLLAWVTSLLAAFSHQIENPAVTGAFSNSSIELVSHHEWWRPFTALFLHSDLLHLSGNVLIGGLFCVLVSRAVGAWRGWLLILFTGTVGNALNAASHYPETFQSIGASTATFAALGILVGLAIAESNRGAFGRMRGLAMPLLAGLILFALFGTSGERTDIGGHAWGGLCGVIAGTFTGVLRWGIIQRNSP